MRSTTVAAAGMLSLVAAVVFTPPVLADDHPLRHHAPHGYLGVATEEEIDLEEGGARILRVVAGSPADRAGDPGVSIRFIGDRPKLGVRLTGTTPELREHLGGRADAGVLVSAVVDDSPAMAAGIVVGDLIEAVDGEPVADAGDLLRALHDADGRRITLDVVRDGRPIVVDVDIPEAETRDVGFGPRI